MHTMSNTMSRSLCGRLKSCGPEDSEPSYIDHTVSLHPWSKTQVMIYIGDMGVGRIGSSNMVPRIRSAPVNSADISSCFGARSVSGNLCLLGSFGGPEDRWGLNISIPILSELLTGNYASHLPYAHSWQELRTSVGK